MKFGVKFKIKNKKIKIGTPLEPQVFQVLF
jgi:hypothetical protein